MLLSKCDDKKPRFVIKQKARGLLSELGIKTPLRNLLTLGDILF